MYTYIYIYMAREDRFPLLTFIVETVGYFMPDDDPYASVV
jgi:hypothetical protein